MAASIRSKLTTVLALLLLLSYSAAFIAPHRSSFTLVPHRANQNQNIASITSFGVKNSNKNNNDADDSESKRTYTKIDDGSPLGVAIVGIGGLLYTKGGDTFSFLQDSSNAVWIILATASTAAGLSRLVRYINDKEIKSDQ